MSKRKIAPMSDARVRLRLLTKDDLPMTLAWRNQDTNRRWFFHSDPISPEQHAAWFARYAQSDDDFVFIIEAAHQLKKPIGQLAVYNINWTALRGEFGRLMIGERDAVGHGLAGAATRLAIELTCTVLHLKQIYLAVYANNAPALHIYRACGFVEDAHEDKVIHMHLDLTSFARNIEGS